jgi:two-component system chemotaxis response regulator CheB
VIVGSPVAVVAIGVSIGGPNALPVLLGGLRADFPVPIVIVQHMPKMFTKKFAARLDNACALTVREASDGDVLAPGGVWIAPGGYHMTVERRGDVRVHINEDPPENFCRPAVDVLFRSVADVYGAGVLAVIMTGMGKDGLRGCKRIVEQRGRVLAQDEASSVVWGMAGAVTNAGLTEAVLPLQKLARAIIARASIIRKRREEPGGDAR